MSDRRRGEILPPELAALIDLAERPRVRGWSLRAALTRYAQPQPQRVSDLLDLVRRIGSALSGEMDVLLSEGPDLWRALQDGDTDRPLVGLLRATLEIDRLGDALAAWAVDRAVERPDAAVDAVTSDVARRLAELGVPEEDGPPPPRGRRVRR